jgi:ubiquinone/menaquinone biosynthesis C-methylase UbiE
MVIMEYCKPYEKLALIYDRLMAHVDYKLWSEYVTNLITESENKATSIADLACGTGNFLVFLRKHFPFVYGCDYSENMVRQARAKTKLQGIPLFVCNIGDLALSNRCVDVVVLLYDSLNYLTDAGALGKAFSEISRILTPGGLFIFDIVSEQHCLQYYADYQENEYWGSTGYSRHSYFDQAKGYQYSDFRIVVDGFTFRERHVQKIYSVNDLSSMLKKNSLEIINIYEEFSFETASEKAERMHFLCQKINN